MLQLKRELHPAALKSQMRRFWELSARKIDLLQRTYDPARGAPVFTAAGVYTSRGWTEWTQGFQFGAALLQYDATGAPEYLELGRQRTLELMAPHLTHQGVHDHGFNNISTYGNLWRLIREGRLAVEDWEKRYYELALKCSGAVQARRWTPLSTGGYIYSFNGPHSLFADTIRSLRALAVSHLLGHALLEENDLRINLLERLLQHALTTARFTVYYGEGRDTYDLPGRVAHESIFNLNDGRYRCPNSQQGYSPFTTWTRGLAWIMCGYAELLEYLAIVPAVELEGLGGRAKLEQTLRRAACVTCQFYLENTPADGVPYWDTGAPQLYRIKDYLERPADPFNEFEPVDSSAAAIAAQGLLRLGRYLQANGASEEGGCYWQAGLTVMETLLAEPYLSTQPAHQGLLLHSVYHRPNGWDYVPSGRKIPCGESSMWGDYHLREAVLYLQRIVETGPYLAFFGPAGQ